MKAIILAGGQGKRMGGDVPKVLHKLQGVTMIERVIANIRDAEIEDIIVVVGEQRAAISKVIGEGYTLVDQMPPRGTGDAVAQCLPHIKECDQVLIVNADTPLLQKALALITSCAPPSLLVAEVDQPFGQGRVIRDDDGLFVEVVEEKDATPSQKLIQTVNTGIYLLTGKDLLTYVPLLDTNNAQGEYYLTDVLKFIKDKVNICMLPRELNYEITNVNTKGDLEVAEGFLKEF